MKNTILMLACLVLCAGARADGDWTPLDPENAPEARSGHTLTLFPDGQVRLFAGANTMGELFNDLAVFNGKEWIAEQPVNDSPPARRDHSAWTMRGKLFVHQGLGEGNTVLSDLWAYDPSTKEWAKINSGGNPTPRYGHSAVPLEDNLVLLIGGKSQNGTALTDVWMLDSGYNHVAFDTAPKGFAFHNALRVDTLTYVFGQGGDMYSYYPSKRLWTALAGAPRLSGHSSAASSQDEEGKKFLHVFGGYDAAGQESDAVYEYDIAANAWTQREQRMPLPLVDSACAALPARDANSAFHFGGLSRGAATNKTLVFTPDGGTPPPAKGFVNQIGALGCGQFSILVVSFPEVQSQVKVDLEWTQANAVLYLHALGFKGCESAQGAFQDAEDLMRFATRKMAGNPSHGVPKSGERGTSDTKTLKNVEVLVALVRHRPHTDPARDIQLRLSLNQSAPDRVTYLFPVGALLKNDPARTHFVRLPAEPIRWHSRFPHGVVGDETVTPGIEWQWNFVDRTPRLWYFLPLPGFVQFTLP